MNKRCYRCPTCNGTGIVDTSYPPSGPSYVTCHSGLGVLTCHGDGEIELTTEQAMAHKLIDGTEAAALLLEEHNNDWKYVLDTLAEYGLEYERRRAAG